jgi:hypothetical protein
MKPPLMNFVENFAIICYNFLYKMIKISKKPKMVARIISFSKANDNFDIMFWQKAGTLSRFSATWKMIEEMYKIKGIRGYKLRLQRSVQNIQQV